MSDVPEWLVKRHERTASRVYCALAYKLDNRCGMEIPEEVYDKLPELLQDLIPEFLVEILEDAFKHDTHAVLDEVNKALQRVVKRFPEEAVQNS